MSVAPPLNPSCPAGGQFFACTTGSLFVGCCDSNDACGTSGCAAGNLRPAGFNSQAAGQYPDQSCPPGSQWFTCADQTPTFLGCCKSDPCSGGCPANDLDAGILNTANDLGFVAASITSTAMNATATAAASVGLLPVASATVAPSSGPMEQASASLSVGAIIGIAVGGSVGLLGLMALAMMCCRRHTRLSRQSHSSMEPPSPPFHPETAYHPQPGSLRSPGLSYTSPTASVHAASLRQLVPPVKYQPYRKPQFPHVAQLAPERVSSPHYNDAISPSSLRSDRSEVSQIRTPVSRFSLTRTPQSHYPPSRNLTAELPG